MRVVGNDCGASLPHSTECGRDFLSERYADAERDNFHPSNQISENKPA